MARASNQGVARTKGLQSALTTGEFDLFNCSSSACLRPARAYTALSSKYLDVLVLSLLTLRTHNSLTYARICQKQANIFSRDRMSTRRVQNTESPAVRGYRRPGDSSKQRSKHGRPVEDVGRGKRFCHHGRYSLDQQETARDGRGSSNNRKQRRSKCLSVPLIQVQVLIGRWRRAQTLTFALHSRGQPPAEPRRHCHTRQRHRHCSPPTAAVNSHPSWVPHERPFSPDGPD